MRSRTPILSTDPNAVEKITADIEHLTALQERMRACNKIIRGNPKNLSTPGKVAAMEDLGFKRAALMFAPDFCGRIGFADFELTNNSANIRRLEKRLAEIQQVTANPIQHRRYEGQGWTQDDNLVEQRVMFEFDGKPDADVRDVLKRNGFKWSPTRTAWVRALNANGLYAAERVREYLNAHFLTPAALASQSIPDASDIAYEDQCAERTGA